MNMASATTSRSHSLEEKQPIEAPSFKEPVLLISGPTASGKSDLAMALAQVVGGEIVSADSMQVYRGMDIGTAKVSLEKRALIAHHLIDICEVNQPFNVVEFYVKVHESIRQIIERGNIPIVVGGAGFYIHALLYGPPQGPSSVPAVRQLLEQQLRDLGTEVLYERLQILDPEYAKTISEQDRHKVVRALEIIALSEKKVSDFQKGRDRLEDRYDFRAWFIYYPRPKLYARIEARCDEMLRRGFVQEVERLRAQGLEQNPAASQAIGYRQVLQFLDTTRSDADFASLTVDFKKASRHYAKRQFTWFRKEPLFRWLNVDAHSIEEVQEMMLHDFEQR